MDGNFFAFQPIRFFPQLGQSSVVDNYLILVRWTHPARKKKNSTNARAIVWLNWLLISSTQKLNILLRHLFLLVSATFDAGSAKNWLQTTDTYITHLAICIYYVHALLHTIIACVGKASCQRNGLLSIKFEN